MSKSARERYNSYGVLITILGLVAVVVFTEGGYDIWDMVIASVGIAFALGFLFQIADLDWWERMLGALIIGMGLAVLISASLGLSNMAPGGMDTPKMSQNLFGTEVLIALVLAVIIVIAIVIGKAIKS